MYNFHIKIRNDATCRQLRCGEALVTVFTCPLTNKLQDIWSEYNYVMYVLEGRKIWHTPNGSYDLKQGDSVFVRKGACIVEQFIESDSCFMIFFFPDEFICDSLERRTVVPLKPSARIAPVMPVINSSAAEAFFLSMMPYFRESYQPDPTLLELKFRELILLIAENPANEELLSWLCSLKHEPMAVLQRVMEDNFCFNLKLEDYAKLCARSLSAFKRDFLDIYQTTPGKWLLERRLTHARHLLANKAMPVADAAFESGFESPSHFSRAFKQKFGHTPANAVMEESTK